MAEILHQMGNMTLRLMNVEEMYQAQAYEEAAAQNGYVIHQTPEEHLLQMKDSHNQYVVFCESPDSKPLGYTIIGGINTDERSIELRRIVIYNPNKGYGRRALRLLKDYSFGCLQAHRLWLDVRAHNIHAFKLYLSEQFELEGTLRDAVFFDGRYISVHVLSILEDTWINNNVM